LSSRIGGIELVLAAHSYRDDFSPVTLECIGLDDPKC
jgi:hypothetical protein